MKWMARLVSLFVALAVLLPCLVDEALAVSWGLLPTQAVSSRPPRSLKFRLLQTGDAGPSSSPVSARTDSLIVKALLMLGRTSDWGVANVIAIFLDLFGSFLPFPH